MPSKLTLEQLPRTGDRDDFAVRVVGPGATDHEFRLTLTGTIVAIWNQDSAKAAEALAGTLVSSHGTATVFPADGFWFDSYNSANSVDDTRNLVRNSGWQAFLNPAARRSLGSELFNALSELDRVFAIVSGGRPFMKSLDILFERSQALEDLESEAKDNAHFMFRICILSGIVDRFDFEHVEGSLNGLRRWLEDQRGDESARNLTGSFQQLKNLRKQYPIHENFSVDAAGERVRRSVVVGAETYFGFRSPNAWAENWNKVLSGFTEAVRALTAVISAHECNEVARQGG